MAQLVYPDEVYAVSGAAHEVYYKLGTGFLEPVYQEALTIEFSRRMIPFESQKKLKIEYKGIVLEKTYQADFVCYDRIIVELKAETGLCSRDVAQVLNYQRAAKRRVGLLFNFGSVGKLEWKRFVL
ncbi:MAG: GxxExxY protein [Acidobacteria bacterium]|nr:GxxExxY protein [Acidobacteriota bacterium]